MSLPITRPVEISPSTGEPVLGAVLGGHRLVVELGRGGMGVVYYAERVDGPGRAALKVLLPEVAHEPAIVGRFFAEARAAHAIRHRGIVEMLGAGEEGGLPYLLMELLEGETLGARLERAPALSHKEAVAIVVEACSALDAAHARGIVHRDLKPENLFLVAGGPVGVKILDFGIAKLHGEGDVARTQTGVVLGTPTYMSPEQCLGERTIDARSDVYALGVMLYELLTGRPPFVHDAVGALIVDHARTPPPPMPAHCAVPAPLEAVVMRALAKSRDQRPSTALDLAVQLEEALDAGRIERAPHLRGVPAQANVEAVEAKQSRQVGSRLQELVLKKVRDGTLTLPAMPRAVWDALRRLREGAGLDRVAAALGDDPLSVPRILRAANAAEGGGHARIETLRAAMTRLGAKRCETLLCEIAAREVFVSKDARVERAFAALWEHSVAVGELSRSLAEARPAVAEAAHLAGLLHDVGKPVVAAALLESERLLAGHVEGPWMGASLWKKTIEACHREVGLALVRHWQLPESVGRVIESTDRLDGENAVTSWVAYGHALALSAGLGDDDDGASAERLEASRGHLGGTEAREAEALARRSAGRIDARPRRAPESRPRRRSVIPPRPRP